MRESSRRPRKLDIVTPPPGLQDGQESGRLRPDEHCSLWNPAALCGCGSEVLVYYVYLGAGSEPRFDSRSSRRRAYIGWLRSCETVFSSSRAGAFARRPLDVVRCWHHAFCGAVPGRRRLRGSVEPVLYRRNLLRDDPGESHLFDLIGRRCPTVSLPSAELDMLIAVILRAKVVPIDCRPLQSQCRMMQRLARTQASSSSCRSCSPLNLTRPILSFRSSRSLASFSVSSLYLRKHCAVHSRSAVWESRR